MTKAQLHNQLDKVAKRAAASRLSRLLDHPIRYTRAVLYRVLFYQKSKRELKATRTTFFGTEMHLLLPSSTDIYLTAGKSHDSEIRLARYLINHLDEGDSMIDIGAHYGYFTLLAANLVGKKGHVTSFEAAPKTNHILQKNTVSKSNVTALHRAVADTEKPLTFYEFPNLYSEYNSLDIEQFKNESWFATSPPEAIEVPTIILDKYIEKHQTNPKVIKIDVEGAEFTVLQGAKTYLSNHSPHIVMEYLSDDRGSAPHLQAERMLHSLGYKSHCIDQTGKPIAVKSGARHLKQTKTDSDNILYIK